MKHDVFPTHVRIRALLAWIALLSLLAACTSPTVEPPTISDPMISDPTPQEPGKEVGISIDVSSAGGATLTYTWNADGGEIVRGQGSPAITYRAPQEPGTYNIRVRVNWDGKSMEKVTSIEVKTGTSVPPTNTATPTSIATSQSLDIRSNCGATYKVTSGTPLKIRYGTWFARGLEAGTHNVEHLTVELIIDDKVVPGVKQEVQSVTSTFPGALCDGGGIDYEDPFGTFYIAQTGPLAPGKHYGEINYSFDIQLTDGYDGNDDGELDFYGPGRLEPLEFVIIAEP